MIKSALSYGFADWNDRKVDICHILYKWFYNININIEYELWN